jgi:hypothetical protein
MMPIKRSAAPFCQCPPTAQNDRSCWCSAHETRARRVYAVVCSDLFNFYLVPSSKILKSLLRSNEFSSCLGLMKSREDELGVMIYPKIAVSVSFCCRKAFYGRDSTWAASLQLIHTDSLPQVLAGSGDGIRRFCMGFLMSFSHLT